LYKIDKKEGDDDDDDKEEEQVEFLGKAPKKRENRVTFYRKYTLLFSI